MPQQVRTRKQGTVDFSANNRKSIPLGRGMLLRELQLRLKMAPTLTATNNTTAKTLRGDEWAVVKSIEVIANGVDVIKKISGEDLWWLNYFIYRTPPHVNNQLGDAATANVVFDSTLLLPFWMPDTVSPMDTVLETDKLSTLELVIEWGQYTSLNASATAWTTEPTLEVYSLESFGLSGPFSTWRVFPIQKTISATNAQLEVDLTVGPIYRGFLIATTDAGVEQGDIVNNIKLKSGSTVFQDINDEVLRQSVRSRRGMVLPYDQGAGDYDDLRMSDESDIAGRYFLDLAVDGLLTEAVDSINFAELKLEFDVTVGGGTTILYITPLQVIPVRGAQR